MDKYSTIKVIGDGTYGSVIKAINKKTGEIVAIKKNEKKVFSLEFVLRLAGSTVFDEVISSEYRQTIRNYFGKRNIALCI